jgi:CheY-like chemotaxis protein
MGRVLVVDDDAPMRQAVRWALEDDGHVVEEAADGRPALERLRASVDGMVVLLDLNMPGLDGTQVLQAVAKEKRLMTQHAFIVTTAAHHQWTMPLAFAQLLSDLHVQVLAKPFDVDELLTTIQCAEARLL